MPVAADASNHHESDSEDDTDYVPEGEERGVIYNVGLLFWYSQPHNPDSDTEEERDAKRPRVEGSPLAPENSAAARRYAPRLFEYGGVP
jgi:hypothetical protein